MSTLFKAGIPITRAMNALAQTTHNDYLKEILEHSIKQLEAGQALSVGLGKYPDVFPPVFLSVMKVGESTGQLDDAFEQLSFYLERDKMIKDKIKEATRYPTFVLVFLTRRCSVYCIEYFCHSKVCWCLYKNAAGIAYLYQNATGNIGCFC